MCEETHAPIETTLSRKKIDVQEKEAPVYLCV